MENSACVMCQRKRKCVHTHRDLPLACARAGTVFHLLRVLSLATVTCHAISMISENQFDTDRRVWKCTDGRE